MRDCARCDAIHLKLTSSTSHASILRIARKIRTWYGFVHRTKSIPFTDDLVPIPLVTGSPAAATLRRTTRSRVASTKVLPHTRGGFGALGKGANYDCTWEGEKSIRRPRGSPTIDFRIESVASISRTTVGVDRELAMDDVVVVVVVSARDERSGWFA